MSAEDVNVLVGALAKCTGVTPAEAEEAAEDMVDGLMHLHGNFRHISDGGLHGATVLAEDDDPVFPETQLERLVDEPQKAPNQATALMARLHDL